MIRSLQAQSFQPFGTILAEGGEKRQYANHHSISLSSRTTVIYQTVADTYLTAEQGRTVLSVSREDEGYQDFYLDRPVKLRGGIRFALTGFRNASTVQLAAFSLPRLIGSRKVTGDFLVQPQLQVHTLYTFFYQEKEKGFLYPGGSLPMYELTYVDQGSLHSVADGTELLLEPGELVVYNKGQWHMQYADTHVAPRFVTLTFDVAGGELTPLFNRKLQLPGKVQPLFQQMLREQEQLPAHATDMILSLLQILLITLLRSTDTSQERLQAANARNSENEIVRRAMQYIAAHVRQRLSVPSVAKSADVSPSYLTALFHKHLQISPGEYIRRLKLQESKQMIREGSMNFTEISEALQYSTVHHFSRQFKEKFGITPSEYAKSVR